MTQNLPNRPAGDLYEVLARARAGAGDLGLRDRQKIDKLERISAAAHKLFGRDGYEGTTLREIAKEADVALGTLWLYARDKRDLTLLIFNRLIPPLMEQGLRSARGSAPLGEGMTQFFEPFYRAYAKNAMLYRIILGQVFGGPSSIHATENGSIRAALMENLTFLLTRAIAAGECAAGIDLAAQARSFYYLYFAAVRVWLGQDEPAPEQGLRELKALFDQHIDGLRPASAETRASGAAPPRGRTARPSGRA